MLKPHNRACFVMLAAAPCLLYGCHAPSTESARLPVTQAALFSPVAPTEARPVPLPSTAGTRFSVTQIQAGREGFMRLQFVAGGRLLALVTQNAILYWDMTANHAARRFDLPNARKDKTRLTTAAISSDGRYMVCFGVNPGLTKTQGLVWDLRTGRLLRTFAAPNDGTTPAIALSPDGGLLAIQTPDRTIRVEDTCDGRSRRTLSGLQYEAGGGMAFSHDGKRLACIDVNTVSGGEPAHGEDDILVWDVTTRRLLRTFHTRDRASEMAFSPDSAMLAVGLSHWTRSAYDVMRCFIKGGGQDVTAIADHSGEHGDAQYSGTTALADNAAMYFSAIGNDAEITRLSDGRRFGLPAGSWEQSSVALSPAGTILTRDEGAGRVTLWKLSQQ